MDAIRSPEPVSANCHARVADEFVALVCGDVELLDKEFAEIVVFNWGDSPPDGSGLIATGGRLASGPTPTWCERSTTQPSARFHWVVPRWTLPRAPPPEGRPFG